MSAWSHIQEVGVDKQTHKDLRKVPDDLLPALEEHLSEMDSIRKANASQPRYATSFSSPLWESCPVIYICIYIYMPVENHT